MTKFLMITTALIFTASAFAAHSESRREGPRTEHVGYGDLDLTSQAGAAKLERRVREAAGRVCDIGGMQTLEDFRVESLCYSTAVSDGLRKANDLVATTKSGSILAATALTIRGR
jgi:UrcA family protein